MSDTTLATRPEQVTAKKRREIAGKYLTHAFEGLDAAATHLSAMGEYELFGVHDEVRRMKARLKQLIRQCR